MKGNCLICGVNNKILLFKTLDKRYGLTDKKDYYNLVKCPNCGFIYLDFTPKNLKSFLINYPVAYWQTSKTNSALRVIEKILVWIKYRRTLSQCPKGRLLDVGCGSAEFIAYCQKRGWDVYGQDVSSDACLEARKKINNVFCGSLDAANYPDKSFDMVFLNSVLHQMENPLKELKTIRTLLKKNGKLVVFVPDISSWQFKLAGQNWFYLDSPRHLFYFQPNSISSLLHNAGFAVKGIGHPLEEFPLDLFHSLKYRFPKMVWPLLLPLSLLLKIIPKFRGVMKVTAIPV